jgi:DinB family protein
MPLTAATRPAAGEYLPYYDKYISLVPEDDALEALTRQRDEMFPMLRRLTEAQGALRYAPGKWSIKQVLGHVTDGERVFAYRAMRFARADTTELPGFDENAYVAAATFDAQPLSELIEQLEGLRVASITMFRGLEEAAWTRGGKANGDLCTVRALAYILAGHARHHMGLIQERYLNAR